MTVLVRRREAGIRLSAIGISTASAIITAACISALPSASCAAMGETYGLAIGLFGMAGLSSAVAFGSIEILAIRESDRAIRSFQLFFLGSAYLLFLTGLLTGSWNIRVATMHCLFGPDSVTRLHDEIPLSGSWFWSTF